MTPAWTRQLRGWGHSLRQVVLIVLSLVVIGIVADRAITSLTPPSRSRGTLTGMLEAAGGPAGTAATPLSGKITAITANRGVLTISVSPSGRFTVQPVVGTYIFTATSPQYEGGKRTCRASRPVTVREGVKTTVTVQCPEK